MPAQTTASEMLPPITVSNGVPGYVIDGRFTPRMAGGETPPNPGEGDPPPKSDDPPAGKDGKPFDADRAQRTIDQLREEVKTGKATARELETARAKLKEFEDKDKSEAERATGKATEAEQKLSETQSRLRTMAIRVAVAESAPSAGIAPENVRAALRLIDADAIELDDDGEPKNVEAALKALVKEFPILAGEATGKKADKGTPQTPKPNGQQQTREERVAEAQKEMRARAPIARL